MVSSNLVNLSVLLVCFIQMLLKNKRLHVRILESAVYSSERMLWCENIYKMLLFEHFLWLLLFHFLIAVAFRLYDLRQTGFIERHEVSPVSLFPCSSFQKFLSVLSDQNYFSTFYCSIGWKWIINHFIHLNSIRMWSKLTWLRERMCNHTIWV